MPMAEKEDGGTRSEIKDDTNTVVYVKEIQPEQTTVEAEDSSRTRTIKNASS